MYKYLFNQSNESQQQRNQFNKHGLFTTVLQQVADCWVFYYDFKGNAQFIQKVTFETLMDVK